MNRTVTHVQLFVSVAALVTVSAGEAGIYVGGSLGAGFVSIRCLRVSHKNRRTAKKSLHFSGGEYAKALHDLRRGIDKLLLEYQVKSWGANQLIPNQDFTPVIPAGPNYGFGVAGNPNSLMNAQHKLENVFTEFKNRVSALSAPLGFVVDGDISVKIRGGAGAAKVLESNRVLLKHRKFPSFSAEIISDNKDSNDQILDLSAMAFLGWPTIQNEVVDNYFRDAPANILDAWLQVPDEEKARIGREIIITEDQQRVERYSTQKSSMLGTVSLLAGYHQSYFQSDAARFGTYYGVEVFYEATLGSQKLTHSSTSTTRTKTGKGNVSITSSTYPSEYEALKVRQPQAWGATAFLGVTLRKGWSFYLPVSWRIASYNIDVQRSAGGKGIEITALTQPISIMEEADKKLSMTDHLRTWKNEFEGGVGVRLSVTSRVTLGMRWTSSFTPTKLAFHSQSYEIIDTANSAKSREIGSRCNVKVQRQKFCLELLWNFRHGR